MVGGLGRGTCGPPAARGGSSGRSRVRTVIGPCHFVAAFSLLSIQMTSLAGLAICSVRTRAGEAVEADVSIAPARGQLLIPRVESYAPVPAPFVMCRLGQCSRPALISTSGNSDRSSNPNPNPGVSGMAG